MDRYLQQQGKATQTIQGCCVKYRSIHVKENIRGYMFSWDKFLLGVGKTKNDTSKWFSCKISTHNGNFREQKCIKDSENNFPLSLFYKKRDSKISDRISGMENKFSRKGQSSETGKFRRNAVKPKGTTIINSESPIQPPETTKEKLGTTGYLKSPVGGRACGIVQDVVKTTLGMPDFQAWRQWLRPGDVLFNSEVGMVEQIRWIEVNNTSALSNAKASGVLGEGLVFGDDGVALAEVETPELRAAIPGNFGRYQAVAWYGVLAYGLIWNATAAAGEARVIHITSVT